MTKEFEVPPFASMFAPIANLGNPSSMLIHALGAGRRKTSTAISILDVPQYQDARVLVIDIDRGTSAFANSPSAVRAAEEGRLNIIQMDKRKVNDTFGQLRYFLGYTDEHGEFIEGEAFNPRWGYDIVIFDTLDVAQQVSVEWHLANTYSEKDPTKKNTQAAWGDVGRWTNGLMWAFQNNTDSLGIIIAHSEGATDDAGKYRIRPKLQGGAKENIDSIPDVVFYLDLEEDPADKNKAITVATTGNSQYIMAKNRSMMPSRVPNFDLPWYYNYLAEKRADVAAKAKSGKPTAVPTTPAAKAA